MRNPGRRTLAEPIPHRVAVACVAMAILLSIGWALPAGADDPGSGASTVEATGAQAGQGGSEPADGGSSGGYLTRDYWASVWNRDRLTGDWNGLRTDLEDHGVKPRVRFSQHMQGVTSGGLAQNGRYGGKVDWILDVDVSKLAGIWPGMFINLHAGTQYRKSVLLDAGPSALPNTPMLVPLPNCDCTEITNLTLMQGLWEGAIPLQEDKGAAVVALGKIDIVDLLTTAFPNFGNGLDGFANFNALYPRGPTCASGSSRSTARASPCSTRTEGCRRPPFSSTGRTTFPTIGTSATRSPMVSA